MTLSYRRHLLNLTVLFAILWSAMAINPLNRGDWLLEDVLVFFFAFGALVSWRWFVFPVSR